MFSLCLISSAVDFLLYAFEYTFWRFPPANTILLLPPDPLGVSYSGFGLGLPSRALFDLTFALAFVALIGCCWWKTGWPDSAICCACAYTCDIDFYKFAGKLI